MSYVAPNIDPYRKGQSFASWFTRLGYHFRVNKVAEADRKDQMFLLGGDFLFEVAQSLYLNEQLLDAAPFDELIAKLKQKLDKTDSALIQRFKFGSRVQQPGETASDFLFSLKLQAEYCNFKDDKQDRILDRILIGLSDDNLRQKLLSEDSEKLNLTQVERIVTTWEMATSNARVLTQDSSTGQIASIVGGRGALLQRIKDLAQGRGPVKSRLGFNPPSVSPARGIQRSATSHRYDDRRNHSSQSRQSRQGRFQEQRKRYQDADIRPAESKNDKRIVIDQRVCHYCGVRGHVKRKCFKLKQYKRDPVNNVNMEEPGTSTDNKLSSMMNRMSWDDKSDDSDKDYNWKRTYDHGAPKSS
ncbi:uncharacterized protein LOC134202085 [Armigeres subalbatus]|uniref:uncharacterized protein LOC134202085 n=1 Tax=Armigeres subalbatus TaxID=124917 RepID=UPI002ED3028B